jgi:hypothetical protein
MQSVPLENSANSATSKHNVYVQKILCYPTITLSTLFQSWFVVENCFETLPNSIARRPGFIGTFQNLQIM